MAMRDLGRQMHCDPSFVTAIADMLEKRGLARREASTADRRIKNLVLTREGVGTRAGHESLPAGPEPVGQDAPPLGIELGEHVVEQQQRPRPAPFLEQLRLAEQERQHRQALLALRTERPQIALAGKDADVVQMRAEAGRAALEVAIGAGCEVVGGGRCPLVCQLSIAEPELFGALAEARPQQVDCLRAPLDELGAKPTDLLVPGSERVAGGEPLRHPP